MTTRTDTTPGDDASPDETLHAPPPHEPSAFIRFTVDLARFGGRQLLRHRAPQLAAALSYRTIFSLVPVLVLSLVMFKALVGADGVRNGLESVLTYAGLSEIRLATEDQAPAPSEDTHPAPQEGRASEPSQPASGGATLLANTLQDFIDRTVLRVQGLNFGAITIAGVLLLVYAGLTLIIQVEQAFNLVCGAPSGRRMVVRFVNYWTLLTLGPLFLVGGIILSSVTANQAADLPAWVSWAALPLQLATKLGLTWLILIVAYTLLPNTRVSLRPAAIGAFVAALLWESLKSGLGQFAANLTDPAGSSQFAVYGSLALIPLFLLWVYITWLIVLFGLELSFALQTVASGRAAVLERQNRGGLIDSAVGVVLMRTIAQRVESGGAARLPELAARVGCSESTIVWMLKHLLRHGLIHRVEQGRDASGYVLALPAEQITADRVMEVMSDMSGLMPGGARSPEALALRRIQQTQASALKGLTLAELVRSTRRPE